MEDFLNIKKDFCGGVTLIKTIFNCFKQFEQIVICVPAFSEAIFLSVEFAVGFRPIAQVFCYDLFQKFSSSGKKLGSFLPNISVYLFMWHNHSCDLKCECQIDAQGKEKVKKYDKAQIDMFEQFIVDLMYHWRFLNLYIC